MNKKGIFEVGMVFLLIFFLIAITVFATIEPLKESLDASRDGTVGGDNSGLNCPGTPNFNGDDYQNDSSLEKLTRRPTCFITGISMVFFVSVVLFTYAGWVVSNWRKP